MIIRVILIIAVIAFSVAFLRWRGVRSRAWSLILLGLLVAATAIAVLLPETTTVVANAVGVGRGADLLIYMLLVVLGFICLVLHKRTRQLQQQLTELARAIAIQGMAADAPPESSEHSESG